jgi:hypothetical protein
MRAEPRAVLITTEVMGAEPRAVLITTEVVGAEPQAVLITLADYIFQDAFKRQKSS